MLAKLVKGLMGIVILAILFSQSWTVSSIFLVLLGGVGLTYLAYKFPMKERYFLVGLVAFVAITRIVSVAVLQTPLESDFKTMYTISQEMLTGSLSETSYAYMHAYGYQVPYILYQTAMMWIHPSVLFLQGCNVVYSVLTVLLLYSIAKQLASKGAARAVTVAYACLLFPMTYVNIVSNQWISGIFLLCGLRIVVGNGSNHPYLRYGIAGACIAIAQLLRPDAVVVMLAVGAYLLYRLLTRRKNWKRYLKQLCLFMLVYVVLTNGVMAILRCTPLVTENQQDDYWWKLVCGLNSSSGGKWNLADVQLVNAPQLTEEERMALEKQLVKERLTLENLGQLWKHKLYTYWHEPDYAWAFAGKDTISIGKATFSTEKICAIAKKVEKVLGGIAFVLLLIGLGKKREKAMVLYAILIGTGIIYLWIEVQGRYSYFTDMLVYILAAIGIDKLLQWYKKRKERMIGGKN